MNAGVSEIDGQEQAAARLNEIVEELPIVETRRSADLVLPGNHSSVGECQATRERTADRGRSHLGIEQQQQTHRSAIRLLEYRGIR